MEYLKQCRWCRKNFTSSRKDTIFCSPKCKVESWRIVKDFDLVEPFLPEKETKSKYYEPQSELCTIYLQWFRRGDERFADVYVSKGCPDEKWVNKMKKTSPVRTVQIK